MKATKQLLFISAVLIGCSSTNPMKSLIGSYLSEGKDHSYSLRINPDSTFYLIESNPIVKSTCEGSWRMIEGDLILLKCFQGKFPEIIARGDISGQERMVKIVNRKKLRLGNHVLKLKK